MMNVRSVIYDQSEEIEETLSEEDYDAIKLDSQRCADQFLLVIEEILGVPHWNVGDFHGHRE